MKAIMIIVGLLLTLNVCNAQYSKEKISITLTGAKEKSWLVTGINTERPEKKINFNIDQTVITEDISGKKKNEKWSLSTKDNIRWFITIGSLNYELIISYNKNGSQYIKLTHLAADNKTSGYYEIKLTEIK